MKLKRGDVLVKLRGGATKRVQVVERPWRSGMDGMFVRVEMLATGNKNTVRKYILNVGEDGLPEGYRLEES